jgi:hypothetical protein
VSGVPNEVVTTPPVLEARAGAVGGVSGGVSQEDGHRLTERARYRDDPLT